MLTDNIQEMKDKTSSQLTKKSAHIQNLLERFETMASQLPIPELHVLTNEYTIDQLGEWNEIEPVINSALQEPVPADSDTCLGLQLVLNG